MEFQLLGRKEFIPENARDKVFLHIDMWNDYYFVTMFYMDYIDKLGELHRIGNIKIGFKGQTTGISTFNKIKESFNGNKFMSLSNEYFSIGTDMEYYKNLYALGNDTQNKILQALNDLAFQSTLIDLVKDEKVFSTSLLRGVRITSITEQFARIIAGNPALTPFNFNFVVPESDKNSLINLNFNVEPSSKPSTNIHAIIGRNGVGKTTLLNGMVQAIISTDLTQNRFYSYNSEIDEDYFSSLVSVSFSAFDTFKPPKEQPTPALGTCYFYIGLKKESYKEYEIKSTHDIHEEFTNALSLCMSEEARKNRWIKAIRNLETDENFAYMQLVEQLTIPSRNQSIKKVALQLIEKMSSGHAVVLLIITKLVATVEEKTLILLDEPESHLHPPLLSAFIRALSNLLYDRNGVAIIATHSPVVLQEIPKSCVWKIQRVGYVTDTKRPDIETFGENVGVLTREVFGLEVVKSGFHKLLLESVNEGKSYEEILDEYERQLGMEAKVLLKILVNERDKQNVTTSTANLY